MAAIFHIVAAREWAGASDPYRGDTLEAVGFIHCSTAAQLLAVADRLFQGRQGLLAVAIDERRVAAPIVYENLEGGDELFPHIYGPLNRDAVTAVVPLVCRDDGTFLITPADAGGGDSTQAK